MYIVGFPITAAASYYFCLIKVQDTRSKYSRTSLPSKKEAAAAATPFAAGSDACHDGSKDSKVEEPCHLNLAFFLGKVFLGGDIWLVCEADVGYVGNTAVVVVVVIVLWFWCSGWWWWRNIFAAAELIGCSCWRLMIIRIIVAQCCGIFLHSLWIGSYPFYRRSACFRLFDLGDAAKKTRVVSEKDDTNKKQ